MAQQFDPTNRGGLFKNVRQTKDTQPGYTGTLNVEGVEYFLDAWLKEGKTGKFFSVSVKRKDKQQAAPAQASAPKPSTSGGSGFDDLDDVPFRQMAAGRAFLAM